MEQQVEYARAIVFHPDRTGEILWLKQSGRQPAFILPGGHVESSQGEEPDVAMLRELREETGIAARSYSLVGIFPKPDKPHHIIHLYRVDEWSAPGAMGEADQLRLNEESLEYAWFDPFCIPGHLVPHVKDRYRSLVTEVLCQDVSTAMCGG